MESDNRIHLTPEVAYGTTRRAESLCGAKLRNGFYYTTVMDGVANTLEGPTSDRVWVYVRARSQHTLVAVSGFHLKVCPKCKEHEDFTLALLAGPP